MLIHRHVKMMILPLMSICKPSCITAFALAPIHQLTLHHTLDGITSHQIRFLTRQNLQLLFSYVTTPFPNDDFKILL